MLVRIKFSKEGPLKFIGHLDTMRYFQKAFSRSGLPIKFSQGFNPHPIMEFANPLGVGLTSNGEYLDFELEKDMSPEEISEALNKAFTDGFKLIRVSILEDRVPNKKKPSAMSLVNVADYLLYMENVDAALKEKIETGFKKYLLNEKLPVTVKTKTSEKELDLKECIFASATCLEDFKTSVPAETFDGCIIPENNQGVYLYLRLTSGSALNVKPEIVLKDFFEKENLDLKTSDFCVHRIEMFHATETGVIPLWEVK